MSHRHRSTPFNRAFFPLVATLSSVWSVLVHMLMCVSVCVWREWMRNFRKLNDIFRICLIFYAFQQFTLSSRKKRSEENQIKHETSKTITLPLTRENMKSSVLFLAPTFAKHASTMRCYPSAEKKIIIAIYYDYQNNTAIYTYMKIKITDNTLNEIGWNVCVCVALNGLLIMYTHFKWSYKSTKHPTLIWNFSLKIQANWKPRALSSRPMYKRMHDER